MKIFFEKSCWTVTREWSEVTWPLADCKTTFLTFQAIRNFFLKSRWTVTRQWWEVTRPSAACQLKFSDVSSTFKKLRKMSLNGHAPVVRGHATVGRLSNNVFLTIQAIKKFFFLNRWTVTRQWSEVTRPSADCQITFFRRFQQLGNFSEKSRWIVTWQWSEVTRPLTDCQTTFFDVSSNSEIFWKKSLNNHRQRSKVTRPSADCQALSVLLLTNRQHIASECV